MGFNKVQICKVKHFLNKKKNTIFSLILSILIIGHCVAFYYAIGPFNLFTDSAGYLSVANSFLLDGLMVFNPNRPIGLPLLYFFVFKSGFGLEVVVWLQIALYLASLFFLIHTIFPWLSNWKKEVLLLLSLVFSTRTFLYSYMILTESLFSSYLIFWVAFSLRFIKNGGKKNNIILFWLFFSILLAFTKSIGFIFLFIAMFVLGVYVFLKRVRVFIFLIISIIIFGCLLLNKHYLGTYAFSKQDSIQLLISANEYINYNSSYMEKEKKMIYTSHKQILTKYYPRTRLDQIIGPIDGFKTPSEILLANSKDYDEYSSKIRQLIFEGLRYDRNWLKYLVDGFIEFEKVVFGDATEGLIIPIKISNYNEQIISWLPGLEKFYTNTSLDLYKLQFSVAYYNFFINFFILPKNLVFNILLIEIVLMLFFVHKKTVLFYSSLILFFIMSGYIYLSTLLVFALDRYFVGVETIFIVFILLDTYYLFSGKTKSKIS